MPGGAKIPKCGKFHTFFLSFFEPFPNLPGDIARPNISRFPAAKSGADLGQLPSTRLDVWYQSDHHQLSRAYSERNPSSRTTLGEMQINNIIYFSHLLYNFTYSQIKPLKRPKYIFLTLMWKCFFLILSVEHLKMKKKYIFAFYNQHN